MSSWSTKLNSRDSFKHNDTSNLIDLASQSSLLNHSSSIVFGLFGRSFILAIFEPEDFGKSGGSNVFVKSAGREQVVFSDSFAQDGATICSFGELVWC